MGKVSVGKEHGSWHIPLVSELQACQIRDSIVGLILAAASDLDLEVSSDFCFLQKSAYPPHFFIGKAAIASMHNICSAA